MECLLQVIQTMLVVSLVIFLLWVLDRGRHLKSGYRWRKILWLLLAVRLLIPVSWWNPAQILPQTLQISLEIPESAGWSGAEKKLTDAAVFREAAVPEERNEETPGTNITEAPGETIAEAPSGRVREIPFSQDQAVAGILGIWGMGSCICLGIRIFQYGKMKKTCKALAQPCRDESLLKIVAGMKQEMGIRGDIAVSFSKPDGKWASSPVLLGFFNKSLVIPAETYGTEELEYVIRHELMHARYLDLWYKLLMVILCDLYWFNPVLRLMKQMAFRDVELVCDERVTEKMDQNSKRKYSRTILKTMAETGQRPSMLITGFSDTKKGAEKRMENIFQKHNRKAGILILSGILLLVLAGTTFVTIRVKNHAKASETAQTADSRTTEEKATEPVTMEDEIVPENNKTEITVASDVLEEDGEAVLEKLNSASEEYHFSLKDLTLNYWDDGYFGQEPILFCVSNADLQTLAEQGKLADLTQGLRVKGWLEQLNPAMLQMVSSENGAVYGIPGDVSWAFGLVLNEDLFRQAGLLGEDETPLIPTTWEELAQTAVQIREKTGAAGFCLPAGDLTGAQEFLNIAWNFGATQLWSRDTDGSFKANLQSEEMIAAMQYLKDLKWKYQVLTEDPLAEDFLTQYESLATGKAAMCIGANDALGIPAGYGMDPGKMYLGALPRADQQTGGAMYSTYTYVCSASASEEEIQAALQVLEELGLGPDLQESTKQRMQAYVENNEPALPAIPVWNNPEREDYEAQLLQTKGTMKPEQYRSFFEPLTTPGSLWVADIPCKSELCMELDGVIHEIMENPDADVAQLLETANINWENLNKN